MRILAGPFGRVSFRRTVSLLSIGLVNLALWFAPRPDLPFACVVAFAAGAVTGRSSWFTVLVLLIPPLRLVCTGTVGPEWYAMLLVVWPLDLFGFVWMGRALRRSIERRVHRVWL